MAFAFISTISLAQNNAIVLNGGTIVMNGGTSASPAYIVVNQDNPNGITRTTNGGYITSENQFNYIKWLVNTSTGNYIFPFGVAGDYIPFSLSKTTTGTSPLTISTWRTNQQNTSKPEASGVGAVTNMQGYADSVKYAIDRFWDVQASNSTTSDLQFSYVGSENTTLLPTGMVKAIRWGGSAWDAPISASSSSMGVTSGIGTAGNYHTLALPSVWTLIVKSDCPNDFIAYAQNSYCKNITTLQEVTHTNDTLNGAFTFAPTGLSINTTTGAIDPSNSLPGVYNVTYTVPPANGCPQIIATTAVTINDTPTISVNAGSVSTTTCESSSVTLTATGADAYAWTGPNFTGADSSVTVTNLSPADAGWYYVTATDTNGCIANDSIMVNVNPSPVVNINDGGGSFCEGQTAQIFATGGVSYAWSGPAGFTSTDSAATIANFSAANVGFYTVVATDANGCSNSDSVALSIGSLAGLDVTASENEVCPGKDIVLTADGANSYSWTGPNGFTSTGSNVTLSDMDADKSGTYYVTGTDSLGCKATDTINVSIGLSGDCLFIPQLVTPNGDNKNDAWVISGIGAFPDAEVYIFNRWGNIVFQASPYSNDWNGQVNKGLDVGKGKLPSATYFYVIKLNNGKDKDIKGYLELQY